MTEPTLAVGDLRMHFPVSGRLGRSGAVVHAVEAESESAVRATWARDPWSETHLVVESIEPWTIRLQRPS